MNTLKQWDFNRRGVDLYEDHLLWWESGMDVSFASGAACEQSFESYLKSGPQYDNVPAEVLEELTRAVKEVVAQRKREKPKPGASSATTTKRKRGPA